MKNGLMLKLEKLEKICHELPSSNQCQYNIKRLSFGERHIFLFKDFPSLHYLTKIE